MPFDFERHFLFKSNFILNEVVLYMSHELKTKEK